VAGHPDSTVPGVRRKAPKSTGLSTETALPHKPRTTPPVPDTPAPRPHPPHSLPTTTGQPSAQTGTRRNPGPRITGHMRPHESEHADRGRAGATDALEAAGASRCRRAGRRRGQDAADTARRRRGQDVAGALGVVDVRDPSWKVSPRTDPNRLPTPVDARHPSPGTGPTSRFPANPTARSARRTQGGSVHARAGRAMWHRRSGAVRGLRRHGFAPVERAVRSVVADGRGTSPGDPPGAPGHAVRRGPLLRPAASARGPGPGRYGNGTDEVATLYPRTRRYGA
jgi:hypothetical protein